MKPLLFIFIVGLAASLSGQEGQGYPVVRNIRPNEYRSAPDNWCVVQDDQGLMYVANGDGVLHYDGARWRLIRLANNAVARWLVKGRDGVIYVGGSGEAGCLQADSTGQLRYVSLINRMMFPEYDLDDFWDACATSEGVFFRTFKCMFRYHNGRTKVWKSLPGSMGFDVIFAVGDTAYTAVRDYYPVKIVGDDLVPLSGAEKLRDVKINGFVPHGRNVLIATRRDGFFLYDHRTIRPFPTSDDAYFRTNFIYHIDVLSDGTYVIATLHGGLAIMDAHGQILQRFTANDVLMENRVNHVMEDRDHALWISFNHGLARMELRSPFELYGSSMGLRGGVRAMASFNNRIYVATHLGLFRLREGDLNQRATFEVLHDSDYEYFDVAAIRDEVMLVTTERVYTFDRNDRLTIIPLFRARWIGQLSRYPDHLIVGMVDGLALMERDAAKRWKIVARSSDIPEEVLSMVEDARGRVWMTTISEGILELEPQDWAHFATADTIPFSPRRFGPSDGLPPGSTKVFIVDGEPVFQTGHDLRRWNEITRSFEPIQSLNLGGSLLFEKTNRLVLFNVGEIESIFKGNRWLLRLSELNKESQVVYYADDLKRQWIGGHELLMRYRPENGVQPGYPLKTMISVVRSEGSGVVYSGFGNGTDAMPVFPPDDNTFEIEYAIPSYDEPTGNRYQYQMEGLDKSWSGWTDATRKEYTHLPAGQYTFRVKGRNVYGAEALPASIQIVIRPPWFASTWAIVIYCGLLGFAIFGIVRLRLHLLQRQTHRLEEEVEKRTQQLKQTQVQLIQTEKMAALGQMVAGISHEINNPLTFVHVNLQFMKERITSLLEYIRFLREKFVSGSWDETTKARFTKLETSAEFGTLEEDIHGMVHTASQGSSRIMRIVEELRKFSNLDAFGQTEADINKNIDIVIDLFLTRYRFISIERNYGTLPWVDCNIGEVNQCLMHILQNAAQAIEDSIKSEILMPEDGRISIWTSYDEQFQSVRIRIRDNGIGVPDEIKAKIFDPFFTTRSQGQGKGLGLSEVFSIIAKHKGSIDFQSQRHRGSEFTLVLPIKRP